MRSLLLLLASSACALHARDTLHIYTWADYLKPEIVARFEKANNCKVAIDTFDSNESMYAKLRAGAAGYDLVVPSSYMVTLMNQQGMLATLDHGKLPNLANIDPDILTKIDDQTMAHSVPYATSYGVLAYRKDKVKNTVASWSMLGRTDLGRRVCVLNDMRETIGAALKSLGYSLNSRDEKQLAAARDVVIGWKQHVAKFDNEQYKSAIDSGEFVLVHGYSGDLFQVVSDNDKVGILFPREGMTMGCDEMVVPKTAPNAALAHAFINFILGADVSAENMEWMGFLCPNAAALKKVSPEFLKNPAIDIPADVRAKCEVIQDLGNDLAKYTRVWDEVKAAK